jgi:riboflavin biosynthesis pyrimidine reductase
LATILRLYPGPPQEAAVVGAYLAHEVHRLGTAAAPFVYANFVCSLDGRIALKNPATGARHLPEGLTSRNDFRLLMELQAQADCVITHGGYLRAIAAGRLDDVLQVGAREGARDLADWRRDNGLAAQPAIVVASGSLDFEVPDSIASHGQRVFVATGKAAPPDKVEAFRAQGYDVILAGKSNLVEGSPLTRALADRGFRSLFLLAGPRMLETMLRDSVLSRLYLTIVHRLIGGEEFHSLIAGPELGLAGRLRMSSLFLDPAGPENVGQWFAQFDPISTRKPQSQTT